MLSSAINSSNKEYGEEYEEENINYDGDVEF